jgi:hypothetical protein
MLQGWVGEKSHDEGVWLYPLVQSFVVIMWFTLVLCGA